MSYSYIHGGYQPEGPAIELSQLKPPPTESVPRPVYDENYSRTDVASRAQHIEALADKDFVVTRVAAIKPYGGYMLDGDTF